MATKEELFAAVQLLRNECKNRNPNKDCGSDRCPIWKWCDELTEECGGGASPCFWPDPTEGGGKADKKTNCSSCGNRNTPVCKYCEHDAEGGSEDGV